MGFAKSEQTQAELLRGTSRLLRERGYAATGVSAIVKETSIPKGSLYHHFPGGKEELAAASVARSGHAIVRWLDELASSSGDPVRAMRAFCDNYIEQLQASDYRLGCPLATIALEAAADVDAVHQACAEAFDGITELFEQRLRGAGLSKKKAHDVAELTVASIEGALMLAKARRDAHAIEVVRDQLTKILQRDLQEARQRKARRQRMTRTKRSSA